MDQPSQLRAALDDLAGLDPVAVDVERADWDRYWRQAALIQVGGEGSVVLVDPLALDDLSALDRFLSERLVVFHAMENDLGPLESAGVAPPRVADTAVAAGLLGLPTGLETLLELLLGVVLETDKQAMQRADWEARPLDREMLSYAAADVADLPALWLELHALLVERGRLGWYEEELAALRAQPPVEERRHWSRVKGVGRLTASAQGRAQALWDSRERLARETDTAPGRIIADKVLVQLAEKPPASSRELPRRGLRRQAARLFGDEVMAALERESPPPARRHERRVTDEDRTLVETLRTLRAERASELGIDSGLLCPSRTLMSAVMADPATPSELVSALGLRPWQWQELGAAFCEAFGFDGEGKAGARNRSQGGTAMAEVLDDETLSQRLETLDGWSGTPREGISKTFERSDFNGSVAFLNRVAELADEANHHPDVEISWSKVTLTYVTHWKGGVTEADIEQARAVDERLG